MAAGRLAQPGAEFGPCVEDCEHRDCAANRKIAAAVCRYCSKPIGFDAGFFADGDDWQYVHEICELESIDAESAA